MRVLDLHSIVYNWGHSFVATKTSPPLVSHRFDLSSVLGKIKCRVGT